MSERGSLLNERWLGEGEWQSAVGSRQSAVSSQQLTVSS